MALQSAFLIYALCCTDAIILSFVLAVPDEGSTTSHTPEGSREQHHTFEGAASSQRNSMARETYKPKGAAMPCPTSQLIGDQQADGDAHRRRGRRSWPPPIPRHPRQTPRRGSAFESGHWNPKCHRLGVCWQRQGINAPENKGSDGTWKTKRGV